ncbi:MAG: glutamate synthase [Oscillospiraceae bacterium]|nr:glutamate synthase [Oscillospiraceae bacterium]
MMRLDARELDFRALNALLRETPGDVEIEHCLGQRFIGAGMEGRSLRIHGVPGNALGAYLNGGEIEVFGSAQDAVGDTMNAGTILVHGSIGDTAGYAMRGGKLYVRDDAGYRAGIHMKAYRDQVPVLIIGGRAGSFLGEYQAGGVIVVLGLYRDPRPIVSNFPCTGMHGGKLFLRGDCREILFPVQVTARPASAEDLAEIAPNLQEFCQVFHLDFASVTDAPFTLVTPDSANPYRQMYVAN